MLLLFMTIRITAGLTNIREIVALFSPTRITYKLNKYTFVTMLSYKKNYSKLNLC